VVGEESAITVDWSGAGDHARTGTFKETLNKFGK
jgi:hypothetical protein